MIASTAPASAASDPGRPRRLPDLGITDGLVQLSFLVQGILSRAAAQHDLSLQQARLLGILRDRQPAMTQLAGVLDLDKSSTTGLVTRAERRGLVERTSVPEDRRAARVALTAEGRRLTALVAAEVEQQLRQAVDGLTETNRRRLSQLASQVVCQHADRHGLDLSSGVLASAAAPRGGRQ